MDALFKNVALHCGCKKCSRTTQLACLQPQKLDFAYQNTVIAAYLGMHNHSVALHKVIVRAPRAFDFQGMIA